MGACFLYGNGGGSDLNFTVRAYATEAELLASTPKENTLGVVTNVPPIAWCFYNVAPGWAEADGIIYFVVPTLSSLEATSFNTTKKYNLWLAPTGCYQRISGAWKKMAAYIYKSGVWVQFSLLALPYFYNAGDFTVEWLGSGSNSGGVLTVTGGSATMNTFEGYFVIPDIHNYKTISCYISSYSNVKPTVSIQQISTGTTVASAKPSSSGSTVSIDVSSLSGNDYYFVLSTNSTYDDGWVVSNVKTTKIWGDAR